MNISRRILGYMISCGIAATYQIETFLLPLGYSQAQIDGAIGYLRRRGLLRIVKAITIGGRPQHEFQI